MLKIAKIESVVCCYIRHNATIANANRVTYRCDFLKSSMAQDQSDLYALVKRMQQGDQAALEQLYDLTVGKIYSIAHITNHQALAEEAVNDVYLQTWRSASSYEPERAAPLSWLMMLTYSRAIDNLRKETNITKQQIDISDEEIEDVRQVRPLEGL